MEDGLQRSQTQFPGYGSGPGKKCGGVDVRQEQADGKRERLMWNFEENINETVYQYKWLVEIVPKDEKFRTCSFWNWITKSLVGPLAQSKEFLYRGSLVGDWVGVWKEFSLKPVAFSRTYKTIPKPIAEFLFKKKKALWKKQNQRFLSLKNFTLREGMIQGSKTLK